MRWFPWWSRLAVAVTLVVVVARLERSSQIVAVTGLVAGTILAVSLYRRVCRPRIRDWRQAEEATARWLAKAGCRRVVLTGGSADGGIDVLTADWAVQVKHTAKRAGRPAVQQLVGAALAVERSPALFSTSGFTAPALDYALDHGVALFELDLKGKAYPLNQTARLVGRRLGVRRR